jgi:VIT1/CCC1 family predicted Fe2+/Mn2+ transporter
VVEREKVLRPVVELRVMVVPAVALVSLLCLGLLGTVGAHVGTAPISTAFLRVTVWKMLAMTGTAGVGLLFGATVG